MSTSAGERGGQGALTAIKNLLPRFGAEIVDTFSLPSFNANFADNKIIDTDLKTEHLKVLNDFLSEV